MRTTLPKESNQIDQPNSRLATTRRTYSPNMPTITSRHTTSSYLLKSSRPLPWKTFANFCPTRIKLASRWMMPKKRSSLSTRWNRTSASPPSVFMSWIPIRIKRSQPQIPMWLLSDQSNNNSNSGLSYPDITTGETTPEDKAPT
jgi:hypothetical protein